MPRLELFFQKSLGDRYNGLHFAVVKVKANFRSQIHKEAVTFIMMISSSVLSHQDPSAQALNVQPQMSVGAARCLEGLRTGCC